MGRACCIGAFVLALASPALAQEAEAPTVRLRYEADSACPDRASFRDLVLARLGYSAFRDDATRAVHVRFELREGGFAGLVALEGAERSLSAARCVDLADAAAVVVALAIDPLGEGAQQSAEPERTPLEPSLEALNEEEPPAPERVVPAVHAPAPPERPLLHLSGGLFFGVGRLPRVSLGGLVRLALGRGLLSLRVEGTFEGALGAHESQALSFRTRAGFAGAALCARWRFMQACLGGRYGALAARLDTETQRVALGYGSAEVSAGWTLGDAWLRVGAAADAPLRRAELRRDGATLWRAAPVLFALNLTAGFSVLP